MVRPATPVLVAIALPVVLALAVAALGIAGRAGAFDPAPVVETGPLAVAPVDAPAAAGPECTSLLAALPATLTADGGALAGRPLTEAAAGVRAWAAPDRPVVARCGLPRPAELTPTSQLLVVDGVQWLKLDDGVPNPVVVTWVCVDRPVYVAVTTPVSAGGGPVQDISDTIRKILPASPVQVR